VHAVTAASAKPARPKWGEPGSRTRRVTRGRVWSSGKYRPVIVIVYPDGVIGLRLLGTRSEETVFAADVFRRAALERAAFERRKKKGKAS
jgi:hypothetical protein